MSYARRRRWEAQLLAREIVGVLGMALAGTKDRGSVRVGSSGRVYSEITPDDALKLTRP